MSTRSQRSFTLLWISQAFSQLGTSVSSLAYPLLLLGITGSAAVAGLAAAVVAVVALGVRIPGGIVADRYRHKALSLVSDACRTTVVAAVGISVLTDAVSARGRICGSCPCGFRDSRLSPDPRLVAGAARRGRGGMCTCWSGQDCGRRAVGPVFSRPPSPLARASFWPDALPSRSGRPLLRRRLDRPRRRRLRLRHPQRNLL